MVQTKFYLILLITLIKKYEVYFVSFLKSDLNYVNKLKDKVNDIYI